MENETSFNQLMYSASGLIDPAPSEPEQTQIMTTASQPETTTTTTAPTTTPTMTTPCNIVPKDEVKAALEAIKEHKEESKVPKVCGGKGGFYTCNEKMIKALNLSLETLRLQIESLRCQLDTKQKEKRELENMFRSCASKLAVADTENESQALCPLKKTSSAPCPLKKTPSCGGCGSCGCSIKKKSPAVKKRKRPVKTKSPRKKPAVSFEKELEKYDPYGYDYVGNQLHSDYYY